MLNWKGPARVLEALDHADFQLPSLYLAHIESVCENRGLNFSAKPEIIEFCRQFVSIGGRVPDLRNVGPCAISWFEDAGITKGFRNSIDARMRIESSREQSLVDIDPATPIHDLIDKIMERSNHLSRGKTRSGFQGYFADAGPDTRLWLLVKPRRYDADVPVEFAVESPNKLAHLGNLRFTVPGMHMYFQFTSPDTNLARCVAVTRCAELLAHSLAEDLNSV